MTFLRVRLIAIVHGPPPAICRAVCERISPNRQAKKAVPILPLFQCEKVCNHVIIVIIAHSAKLPVLHIKTLFFRNQSIQASIVGFIPQLHLLKVIVWLKAQPA